MPLAICIGCGCDDLHACFDEVAGAPCRWLAVDYAASLGVCSACPEDFGRWQAGDRSISVPAAVPSMVDREDLWCLWPDGTLCQMDELESYLTFMSDDYERIQVSTYCDDGTPETWARHG